MRKDRQTIYIFAIIVFIFLSVIAIEWLGYLSFSQYSESFWIWIVPFLITIFIFSIAYYIWRELKKLDELKNEFITIASHHLRVPLTRIKWAIESLSSNIGTESDRQQIKNIRESFVDLTEEANQLLSMAEAEKVSNYFDYVYSEEYLQYIVTSVLANYQPGIRLKKVVLTSEVASEIPKVYIDKLRIKTVVSVMLENAILYTPAGGKIAVQVFSNKKGDEVIFSIKDTGIGIDKDKLPQIFTKFFRTREAMATDMDHAGLGLSIIKEIVEKHGGKIGVESEGKNRGSRFWFSLPVYKI